LADIQDFTIVAHTAVGSQGLEVRARRHKEPIFSAGEVRRGLAFVVFAPCFTSFGKRIMWRLRAT